MPAERDLRFHADGCDQCAYLSEYLHENRTKSVDGPIIRYMHQEMSCLSAKGWAWALPHYLPFCLTPEAEYNKIETEFLIYNLAPKDEFKADTIKQLSLFSRRQLSCLVRFLEWASAHAMWKEYCPEDISRALMFVREL